MRLDDHAIPSSPCSALAELGLAIASEQLATAALKAASTSALLCFLFDGADIGSAAVAVAYGMWAGLGMVLVSAFGVACFGQYLGWSRICVFALITAGVVLAY